MVPFYFLKGEIFKLNLNLNFYFRTVWEEYSSGMDCPKSSTVKN